MNGGSRRSAAYAAIFFALNMRFAFKREFFPSLRSSVSLEGRGLVFRDC